MKLIGSYASPYVRKVRIVLAEKKIECAMEVNDVWSSATDIGQFNPIGKVPCLLLDDGAAVYDSRVIVEYLDAMSPVSKLIPDAARGRAQVKCWEALSDGLLDAALSLRAEDTRREPSQRSESWMARQRGKIDAILKAMSSQLGERSWAHDERYSLADIAIGVALGYLDFRFPQIDWREPHPNLARHFERLSARAAFADTVPRG